MIDETSVALRILIYAIKGVVRLRGHMSILVKIMFVQTLTSLRMDGLKGIERNLSQMLRLVRQSVAQKDHIYILTCVFRLKGQRATLKLVLI